MSLVEAFLPSATSKTEEWIRQMRERHMATARPLRAEERIALRPHFDGALLDSVRVKETTEVAKPPFYEGLRSQLLFVGMRLTFDFAAVGGLTFDDCVLIRRSPLTMDLLFHEMVHVEQYRQLGISRFVAAYVRGFAESGFRYEEIPHEKIAFLLTDRFGADEEFCVRDEIATWIALQEC